MFFPAMFPFLTDIKPSYLTGYLNVNARDAHQIISAEYPDRKTDPLLRRSRVRDGKACRVCRRSALACRAD